MTLFAPWDKKIYLSNIKQAEHTNMKYALYLPYKERFVIASASRESSWKLSESDD